MKACLTNPERVPVPSIMDAEAAAVKRRGRAAVDGPAGSPGQSVLMPETSQSPSTFSIVIVTQFL